MLALPRSGRLLHCCRIVGNRVLLTISVANTRVRTNEPPECERWRYRIAIFYGCTELTLVDLAQGALTCRQQLKIVVTENVTFQVLQDHFWIVGT